MANALTCAKCGNEIASDLLKLEFDGNCPWCLAAFALSDPPQPAPKPAGSGAFDSVGKYVLTERLGTGGMGEVWKALDTELNRWVALKFLKDQDPKEVARFAREAHMSAKLSHPNIAAIHEIGQSGGRRFIAMQCVQGRTLETYRTNDRRLLVRLCLDAAKALDHAHRQGVIHRDVKPANLMVEEDEEGVRVVVLDFGLARPIEGGDKLSASGSVVGTPQYLSPEQARGERLDERTDVYSLGATMYEVFTGRTPFEGANVYEILKNIENEEPVAPRKIKPQINQDLQTIILKCLEKNRERRYTGARELANDLRRFLNHEAVLARPPSAVYQLKMRLGKRKSLVAAVAAFLCLVVGAAVVIPKLNAESAARARLVEYQGLYTEGRNAWDEILHDLQHAPLVHAVKKAREARKHFEKAIGILELAEAQVMRGKCFQLEGSLKEAEAAWERALVLDPGNQEARFHLAKMLLLISYNSQAPALADRDESGGGYRICSTGPETADEARLRARAEKLLAGIGGEEKAAYLRGVLEVNRRHYPEGAALLAQYNREGWDTAAIALEGSARLRAADYEGAIRVCNRAIGLDPRNAHTYFTRGLARESTGLHDAANEDFNEAIRRDSNHAGAYHSLGNSHLEQKRTQEAIKNYEMAIRLDGSEAVFFYSLGNAKRDMGLPKEAIANYDKATRLNPALSMAYVNRGCLKSEQGLHDEAIADFDEVLKLNPEDAGAYYNRALAKQRKGLPEAAILDYTEAIRLRPINARAHYNRGNSRYELRLYELAIEDFTKAFTQDPVGHLKALINRGNAKRELGLIEEAKKDFTEVITREPNDATAYCNRGALYCDILKLYDEAIRDFNTAIQLDQKFTLAYMNRGIAFGAQGRTDEAIDDFSNALTLDPELVPAYWHRGDERRKKEQYAAAIADYTDALNRDPKCLNAYAGRAEARKALGLHKEAAADIDAITKFEPKDAQEYYLRGNAKRDLGYIDEAIADFSEAIKRDPKHARALANRGNLLADKRKFAEAMADYNDALKQNPQLPEAYFNRATLWRDQGLLDKAIEDLDKAIEYNPRFTHAFYNRGNYRSLKGLHVEAIEDFSKAVELAPGFAEGWANLAYAEARLGRIDDAVRDWMKALKVAPKGWSYEDAVRGHIKTRAAVVILDEGDRLNRVKQHREAIERFKGLMESHPKTPFESQAAYGMACSYALMGEKKNALDWLEKAVGLGWADLDHIEKDSDMDSLRAEARYQKVVERLRAK